MKKMVHIKKIIVLVFVCNITLFGMNSNQQNNKRSIKKIENRLVKETEYEFLLYPQGTEIKVDGELPDDVTQFGNIFVVPKGMDATLIHKTIIPKRVADFGIQQVDVIKK